MALAALVLSLILAPQETLDDRIRSLVELLRSPEIATREKATRDLASLGVDVLARLEKIQSGAEGEVRARLTAAIETLRREVRFLKLAPPVRRVTLSAKERPLKEVLEDAGLQAGVTCAADPAVADSPVTFEAKGEPLLQALDRMCLARGDLALEIAEGRVRVAAGKPAKSPVAYSGSFRARVRRVDTHDSTDFAGRKTHIVLYVQVDAQPDQKCAALTTVSANPGADGLAFKAANESPMAWMMSRGDQHVFMVDEVPVIIEAGDTYDGVYVLKNAPADLKTISSIKLRAIARYPLGLIPKSMPLVTGKLNTDDGVLPFTIQKSGHHIFIQSVPRRNFAAPRPLEELLDPESFVAVDKEGKEIPLTNQTHRPAGLRFTHRYQFVAETGDIKAADLTLKFNMVDLVDREVEFELRDIKLKD
ncbi:MAG TPA: hypothetical protein VJU16_05175 [Planctomycetota bacterium]|nr:hypothetical protein [Planctomycetota bacterium]